MEGGGFEFTLVGVPVKVLWMFLFVAVLFGLRYSYDPMLLVMWVAIMFLSILFHEMGHALMYRRFGVRPSVVIHGFGGLTYGRSLPVGRDLLVSLAGPGVGLAIGLPLKYVQNTMRIPDFYVGQAIDMAIWTNVGWAILNLLPLMPLDGGNATNAFLSLISRRDMTRPTRMISIITAAVLVVLALQYRFIYGAFLAGWYGFQNFQALQNGSDVSRFSQHSTYKPPKVKKASRRERREARNNAANPQSDWTAPSRPPQGQWEPPGAKSTSKLSTVGWVQPGAKPQRSFADELETAAQALSRDQPELAAIALDRARKRASQPHELAAIDQLQAEINGRLTQSD